MRLINGFLLSLSLLVSMTPPSHAGSGAGSVAATEAKPKPDRIAATGVPLECRQFLQVPADATGEWLAWAQRLSLAACSQARTAPRVVNNPEQLRDLVTSLDASVQASIAIYHDALARGPEQIRMLAAYGLGMAYVNVMVRARIAIPSSPELMTNLAVADKYLALHQALEPLLTGYARDAASAFAEADRLATQYPEKASANEVMRNIVKDARTALHELGAN